MNRDLARRAYLDFRFPVIEIQLAGYLYGSVFQRLESDETANIM